MGVKVYSTKRCPWCVKAKEHLDSLGVAYDDIYIEDDREAREHVFKQTKQSAVPIIEIGNNFVVGFDEETIDRLLKEQSLIA